MTVTMAPVGQRAGPKLYHTAPAYANDFNDNKKAALK